MATAQFVPVGQAYYSTSLPPGAVGPQLQDGSPAMPKISADFSQPIQTNNFWSSLMVLFEPGKTEICNFSDLQGDG